MTKADLVDAIASSTELKKSDSAKALESIIDAVQSALKKGEDVRLVGFGTFSVRKRDARKGRNPQTGKEIKIAAKKVPVFKAGKTFKESVA
jgi:DNA-binding protein HU-beta